MFGSKTEPEVAITNPEFGVPPMYRFDKVLEARLEKRLNEWDEAGYEVVSAYPTIASASVGSHQWGVVLRRKG